MARIIKWHYQPDGAWQLMYAEYCGSSSREGVMTTAKVDCVTCIKCTNKMIKQGIKTMSTEELLKKTAESVVLYGGRAGSVYQAMLDLGHLVSLEDCQAAVKEVLEQLP